jgi:ABC-type nitrate/sulfonate/bicarbonate transport system ATPase subunit
MKAPNGREHSPLIRLDRISKSFMEAGRERVVLHEVSAAFDPGEFVVLIGKSGSGKSTLLGACVARSACPQGRSPTEPRRDAVGAQAMRACYDDAQAWRPIRRRRLRPAKRTAWC